MAIGKEDESKLNEYLQKRLTPLMKSGAVRTVDWDREPLPHEVNFQIKTLWTPASELRKQQAPTLSSPRGKASERRRSRSPQRKRHSSSSPEILSVSKVFILFFPYNKKRRLAGKILIYGLNTLNRFCPTY